MRAARGCGRLARILPPLALLTAVLAPAACARPAAATQAPVTVLATWTGAEGQQFKNVLASFTAKYHFRTTYTGARALDQVLQSDISNRNPPDVVVLPSPGALDQFAAIPNGLVPLGAGFTPTAGHYGPLWGQLTKFRGQRYAVVVRAALKSMIWYNPTDLRPARAADWTQLMRLTRAIAARGRSPWCIGVGSTSQSGWPGTDWIEDIVLHEDGVSTYRDWANGNLSWTSPKIRQAWQQWIGLLSGVRGGAIAAMMTDASATDGLMFSTPPGCYLNHEAFRDDYPGMRYFPFPAMGATGPAASEVSADLAAAGRNTPGSRALISFLASDEGQAAWQPPTVKGKPLAGADLLFSADESLTPRAYPHLYSDPVLRTLQDTLIGSGTLCFDASDLMPPVLSDAFEQAVLQVLGDLPYYSGSPPALDSLLAQLDQVRERAYPHGHPNDPCAR